MPSRELTPEETLEVLESFASPLRELAVGTYLLAAFWPWWLTFLVIAFLLWQTILPITALMWATIVLAVLAGGGWLAKRAFEMRLSRGR